MIWGHTRWQTKQIVFICQGNSNLEGKVSRPLNGAEVQSSNRLENSKGRKYKSPDRKRHDTRREENQIRSVKYKLEIILQVLNVNTNFVVLIMKLNKMLMEHHMESGKPVGGNRLQEKLFIHTLPQTT